MPSRAALRAKAGAWLRRKARAAGIDPKDRAAVHAWRMSELRRIGEGIEAAAEGWRAFDAEG